MSALGQLLNNEKGLVGICLIIGATVLAGLGKMPVDQWQNFATWIFGIYASTTAIHASAVAIAAGKAPTAAPPSSPTA